MELRGLMSDQHLGNSKKRRRDDSSNEESVQAVPSKKAFTLLHPDGDYIMTQPVDSLEDLKKNIALEFNMDETKISKIQYQNKKNGLTITIKNERGFSSVPDNTQLTIVWNNDGH
jgi:predicted phosphodiesterase